MWIADLAAHPQVKPRLRKATSDLDDSEFINIYACDITPSKFPSQQVLDGLGCQVLVQDLTKPFPADMYGKFDLVRMSLVVLALRPDEWTAAIENIRGLLSTLYDNI